MKLLESSSFEAVNSALFVETGEAKIVGRYAMIYAHRSEARQRKRERRLCSTAYDKAHPSCLQTLR